MIRKIQNLKSLRSGGFRGGGGSPAEGVLATLSKLQNQFFSPRGSGPPPPRTPPLLRYLSSVHMDQHNKSYLYLFRVCPIYLPNPPPTNNINDHNLKNMYTRWGQGGEGGGAPPEPEREGPRKPLTVPNGPRII